jgi:HD-like signal output (HDOD) protein
MAVTLADKVNETLALLTAEIKSQKLDIPTPPDVLLKLNALLNQPEFNVDEVADLLQQDPNISGRLIRVANSVIYSRRNPANNVSKAVARLGSKNVLNLVRGITISQQFLRNKTRGLENHLDAAWKQSQSVAALTYVIAVEKSKVEPDTAFLAGLIHNIGMLPLYLRLLRIPELTEDKKALTVVCDQVVPKLYPKAGKMITQAWHFPKELIDATTHALSLTADEGDMLSLKDTLSLALYIYQHPASNASPLPETFTDSPLFKKCWATPEEAIKEIAFFIKQTENLDDIHSN